jgi:site-specific DNA-methyltransferase (adenine-specific)
MSNREKLPINSIIQGNCLETMLSFPAASVDLVYLDPPFLTDRHHVSHDRDSGDKLKFSDKWKDEKEYLSLVENALREAHRLLKESGTVFLHCDHHASHLLRVVLDRVFGRERFLSEIIWAYKRWTNGDRNFQRAHQTIFFYSKTASYYFSALRENYSQTTNLDQIWQKRGRDKNGKSITLVHDDGSYVPLGKPKLGVVMRDVWEIPYLNPTAKERTGYPTQKPLAVLDRIIRCGCPPQGIVLDPFVGSGTSVLAASKANRQWVGIDVSAEAVTLCERRLAETSQREECHVPSDFARLSEPKKLELLSQVLNMNIVYRNRNLNGFLKSPPGGELTGVRIFFTHPMSASVQQFLDVLKTKRVSAGLILVPGGAHRLKEKIDRLHVPSVKVTVRNLTEYGLAVLEKGQTEQNAGQHQLDFAEDNRPALLSAGKSSPRPRTGIEGGQSRPPAAV